MPAQGQVPQGQGIPGARRDRHSDHALGKQKLKDELAEARADLKSFKEETGKTVAKMAQMSKVALDRQRTQLEDKYSAAIDAATEVGDKDQVRKLRDAERKDLKEFDEKVEEASEVKADQDRGRPRKDVNGRSPKDVQDTIGGMDRRKQLVHGRSRDAGVANAHHGKLLKDKPGMTLAENLEETRKYVAKRYPRSSASRRWMTKARMISRREARALRAALAFLAEVAGQNTHSCPLTPRRSATSSSRKTGCSSKREKTPTRI
jgi:hypothetical protein